MIESLPTGRAAGRPFDPPRLPALSRFRFPDGHVGWLAASHALVREVLSDRRFSSRYELLHYPLADAGPLPPAPIGDLTGLDAPEHTRLRKPLAGKFTVRRMNLLAERAAQVTAEYLDALEPPVDLVPAFAQPVPAVMICELLGVPYGERETFKALAARLTGADSIEAFGELAAYIGNLVAAKRAHPTDDLLSDLTEVGFSDEELTGIGAFLLGAGLDTTTNMIALGTYALISNPSQVEALIEDPARAVEELMRYLSIAHTGARTALEDVTLGGELIRAGETVALSIAAANRDPAKFPDPDRLDLRRDATGHIGFGHGIHQCLGQQLARVEMRAALPALFSRFPGIRLAGEVRLREGSTDIFGAESLPVTFATEPR